MAYCEDLNERLREQEKYWRKDFLVILNPPFDAKDEKNGEKAKNVNWFCKKDLNVDLIDCELKAHHVLSSCRELTDGLMPSCIVKLNKLNVEDDVYRYQKIFETEDKKRR